MSGKTSKKGVLATWPLALEKARAVKNPIKFAAGIMYQEFPQSKTKWEKWVNLARQRYNRGLYTEGKRPAKPIPVFPTTAKAA